jgi:hypothetical protein
LCPASLGQILSRELSSVPHRAHQRTGGRNGGYQVFGQQGQAGGYRFIGEFVS